MKANFLYLCLYLVYWATLYTPDRHYLDFENFSGHGLIAASCLIDVAVSDRPWRIVHVLHPVLFSACFGAFSLVYFLCGGTNYYFEPYIYIILDWSRPIRYKSCSRIT